MRRLSLLVLALVVAGCGSSSTSTTTKTTEAAPPGPGTALYAGGNWAVVVDGAHATAFHRVAGSWHPDRSGAVKIDILGPKGKVARRPQCAVQLTATSPLVESGMWVDGHELVVKGGGLKPDQGTIYGAPDGPLAPGKHVAVAYGRTGTHATMAMSLRSPLSELRSWHSHAGRAAAPARKTTPRSRVQAPTSRKRHRGLVHSPFSTFRQSRPTLRSTTY